MIYSRFTRFLVPLAITSLVLELGAQVLNAGTARMPQATETLAAFGLAWALVLFLASPLGQSKQLGLVLVDSPAAQQKTQRFVLVFGLLLTGLLALLATTAVGDWVIEDLHGVSTSLANTVRLALFWLIPVPVVRGLALFYAGILTRARRTDWVSYGMVAGITSGILTVFVLLPLPMIRVQPIRLPVLSTYMTVLVEFAIVWWGSRRFGAIRAETTASGQTPGAPALSVGDIIRFFWPLAVIMLVQELSRPLINLFIAREAGGAVALAVLTVVYPLGQLPYRWLNEIRSLPTAFRSETDSLRHVRRFAVGCGLLSFGVMLVLYWTPLRDVILLNWIGVSPELAAMCRVPLYIFSFFSFVVAIRAYLHGIGLLERRTQAMVMSAPARLAAIFLALTGLPLLGVHGATLGVAALLAGFCVETVGVWWGVRGRDWLTANRLTPAANAGD